MDTEVLVKVKITRVVVFKAFRQYRNQQRQIEIAAGCFRKSGGMRVWRRLCWNPPAKWYFSTFTSTTFTVFTLIVAAIWHEPERPLWCKCTFATENVADKRRLNCAQERKRTNISNWYLACIGEKSNIFVMKKPWFCFRYWGQLTWNSGDIYWFSPL